jgi:hypothetical protein
MRRRVLTGLVVGALMAAMLPGVATAGGPSKDHVTGTGLSHAYPGSHVWVSAHSDGDGSSPRGKVVLENFLNGFTVTAEVVCLDVYGDWAAVGAIVVGSDWPEGGLFQVGSDIIEYFVDDGPASVGSDRSATTRDDAEGCSAATIPYIPDPWWATVEQGNFVVKDGD